jgi:uncharacterized protein YmfQ (DUF2313 family)
MYCPTKDDTLASLLALLPRGRAWQSEEGGPEPYKDAAFNPSAFDATAFDTDQRAGSILYRFWEGVAYVVNFANDRLCALASEMFCATHSETHDEWLREYGLPDPCDPFPDLCAKVAAIGGARCEYFTETVARAGWSVECDDSSLACGGRMGMAQMGCAQVGAVSGTTLRLLVDTGNSPSYTGNTQTPPLMGLMQMGMPIACAPDIEPLRCLMDRIAPAHVEIQYVLH